MDGGGLAYVAAHLVDAVADPRRGVQGGIRRRVERETRDRGAELAQPEDEPGPLEARVAGHEHAPTAPEGRVGRGHG